MKVAACTLAALSTLGVFSSAAFAQAPAPALATVEAARLASAIKRHAVAVVPQEAAPQEAAPQEAAPQESTEQQAGPATGLLVFLDCDRRTCDQDYLRREITFINYVRQREDSQVHVLVTRQRAGGAGQEYTFDFIGRGDFEGDDIRHTWVSSNTNTEDEQRAGIAQMLRVGILHYLAKTPLIDQIEIRQEVRGVQDRFLLVDPADDPWNFWVFRINLQGEISGEDRRSSREFQLRTSANRTTEDWKLRFNANFEDNERTFILNDGSESIATNNQYSFTHQTVKTLGPQWGASIKASVMQATFVNIDRVAVVAPGIEFNFFPYSESSRRIFTLTYEVGLGHYNYFEETIFGVTEEALYDQTFLVDINAVQPWGELEGGVQLAQFFNDLSQWRAVVEGRLEFRIVRGLSFNVDAEWAAIRDQRYLAAEGQTDEEILLELRALQTDSTYEISVGITYTFGSIFNNVVNPRFANNRGDFNRFF